MALIPYAEAQELGLVPRKTEEDLEAYFAQQGRYPAGFPRARGGAGPFWRIPGLTGRGIQPTPWGGGRAGIQSLRFGLGPLMMGLGLSAPPSGSVPVGRAAARGRGDLPDVQTLLGRGDVQTIRRLIEEGLLDPRAVPPGVATGMTPPGAARPRAAAPSPPEAPAFAQMIAQAKQALAAAKQAVSLGRLIEAVGGLPPGSFERSLEIEEAFQAQRQGERTAAAPAGVPPPVDPLTGLPTESAFGAQIGAEGGAQGLRTVGIPEVPTALLGEIGAGGAPPSDIFDPDFIGGMQDAPVSADLLPPETGSVLGGVLPILGAGLSAAQLAQGGGSDLQKGLSAAQAATQAASGVATLTGSSLGGAAPVLPYIGAALGIGQTIAGNDPDIVKALDAAAYAGAPFTLGLTALLPEIARVTGLKKLLGAGELSHAQREGLELSRAMIQAGSFAGRIGQAHSWETLYDELKDQQTGYVGGTRPLAVQVGFEGAPYLGLYGMPTGTEWKPDQFFKAVLERPQDLQVGIQAGVRPDMLGGGNDALKRAIINQARLLTNPGAQAELQRRAEARLAEQQDRTWADLRAGESPDDPEQYRLSTMYQVGSGSADEQGNEIMSWQPRPRAITPPVAGPSAYRALNWPPAPADMVRGGTLDFDERTGTYRPGLNWPPAPAPTVSQAEQAPPPPPDAPAGPGESPLIPEGDATFHAGGLIGRRQPPGPEARINALEGEYVVNPEATRQFQPLLESINRAGGAGGVAPGASVALRQRQETQRPWFIANDPRHQGHGLPFQAKKNPDPKHLWRLATTSRELSEALGEGEPVIAIQPGVLAGARMGMASALMRIDQARQEQYEQPGEGIETLEAIGRGRRTQFSPEQEQEVVEDYTDRLQGAEEASRETGVFPVRPFLAPPPTLPRPTPRFPIRGAFPQPPRPEGL